MRFIKLALLIVALYILIVAVFIKLGHGHPLLETFTNASGTPCCRTAALAVGVPDCAEISAEEAVAAGVGSVVMVRLPWGEAPATINIVHPSPDNKDYACTTGCLIRRTLY